MRDERLDEQGEEWEGTHRVQCYDGPFDGAILTWASRADVLAVEAYQHHGVYVARMDPRSDVWVMVWVPEG